MHKHIDVKLLLDLDNLADFFLDGTHVFLLRDPATTHFNKKKKWRHDSNNISGGTYFFALYSRRTLLSSIVWGNEPIVVVGRTGRLSFFCWASNLAETLVARRWSEPFKAATCKKCISALELMCTNIQSSIHWVRLCYLPPSGPPHLSPWVMTSLMPEQQHWLQSKPVHKHVNITNKKLI